jgi:prepilin peptidase CpaA
MPIHATPLTALYILLLMACIFDVRDRRVPQLVNGLILGGGLLYQLSLNGLAGALTSLLGALMCLGLLIVPFALYVYRGGDVKLCLGVGAWLGWEDALWFIAYGVLLGGALGLGALGWRRMSARQAEVPSTVPMAVAFSLSALYLTLGG